MLGSIVRSKGNGYNQSIDIRWTPSKPVPKGFRASSRVLLVPYKHMGQSCKSTEETIWRRHVCHGVQPAPGMSSWDSCEAAHFTELRCWEHTAWLQILVLPLPV